MEGAESEETALVREITEELGVCIRPVRRLWQSVTPWNVHLSWWLVEAEPNCAYRPDPAEVESIHWVTLDEMQALPALLESNHHFLKAIWSGEIELHGFPHRNRGS